VSQLKSINDLNPEQRRAVLTTEGHVLVLAGAGSGKTKVLTERIAYLIKAKGVSPQRILAFTFTNKAAGEMRARVEKALVRNDLPFWVGTFHATGLKILRREAKHIGFSNNFAVFDEDDSTSLVRDIIKKRNWDLVECPPPAFRAMISKWKNDLVPPEEAIQSASGRVKEMQAQVYHSYCHSMRKFNAFDFDDLITRVVELFTAHPKVKERYARQFRYVLVDEFQDTNAIQMVMIDAVASRYGNLFVVGDDDQAIYGWRGATIENILQFDRLYSDTVTIRLEENYRSTSRILEAANSLISCNLGRKGKNLWSKKGKGEFINMYFARDEMEEAGAVREGIIELIRSGYKRSEIAVLYRTHAQSRAIETSMLKGGLPYQIIGGVRFYERREIKDLLGYLKLINNPNDDVNFRRIVNVPRRGIGRMTLERIEKEAGENSLLTASMKRKTLLGIPAAGRKRVEEFSKLMASLRLMAKEKTAYELLLAVIERTGYRDYLMEDPKTAQTRLENIDELLVETQRFVSTAPDPGLASFLEEIALISDIDALKSDENVALMTLHNSKGLEYRAVMITGLEEGLLPHYSSFEKDDELEEERRLFYVGITRAKENLSIFTASNRRRFGDWTGNKPSRFLDEIPSDLVRVTSSVGIDAVGEGLLDGIDSTGHFSEDEGRAVAGRRFYEGASVIHPTYGEGKIRKVEGSGHDMKVTVYFPGKGAKKFLANYAPFRFA
jgi:DNA helicase-2/ATP-dependent DNA helicase PcrA